MRHELTRSSRRSGARDWSRKQPVATAAPRCVCFQDPVRSDRHTRMTRLTALVVVTILWLLALVHVYWAVGAQRASATTIPEIDGRPAFRPSRLATLAVAIALLTGAALVAIAGRLWVNPLGPRLVRLLTLRAPSVTFVWSGSSSKHAFRALRASTRGSMPRCVCSWVWRCCSLPIATSEHRRGARG
jgi:hypothetical protein